MRTKKKPQCIPGFTYDVVFYPGTAIVIYNHTCHWKVLSNQRISDEFRTSFHRQTCGLQFDRLFI